MLSLVLQYCFGYTKLFIFLNRVPVMLLGYAVKRHAPPRYFAAPSLLLGALLLYFWGFTSKLNLPFRDFYYVLAIPVVLGLADGSRFLPDGRLLRFLSGATFEMYAIQMLIGSRLVTALYRVTGSAPAADALMLLSVTAASLLVARVFTLLEGLAARVITPAADV